ncbi:MAG: Ig-like domain-containing protein, partial [Pseudomonadota bacterium]
SDGANPGFDALHFPELNRSDIRLSRAGDQNLYVNFADPLLGGPEFTVTIGNHFAGRPVEEIRLADGVIPLTAGLELVGTEFADNFGGTEFNDTLIGLGGNDGLSGLGGDDTLIGGDGADNLQGGTGSDIYILESGLGDVIVDAEGDRDQVFLDGLNFNDVRLVRPDVSGAGGISLQIFEKSTGIPAEEDVARINNQFSETGQIEVLIFANGEELDLMGGLPFTGSEIRDSLRGTEFDDEFFAGGDRDFIDAGDGNDLIVGEGGNDVLFGGVGDDIYVFRPGDGEDTIVEAEVVGQDGSGSEDTIILDGFSAGQFEIEDFFFFYIIQLGADSIRVNTPGGVGNPIESIVFGDGTSVDLTVPGALENTIPEGVSDILEGIAGDETLSVPIDDLLANDLDVDPDTVLEIVGVEQGTGGTASLQGDSLVFLPAFAFLGLATFIYLLSDGIATVPVEVAFEVEPVVPTDEDDTIIGTEGQDIIDALGGDDLVLPLSGDDTLEGGVGTDTLSFSPLVDPTLTSGAATFGVFVDLSQQGGAQNTRVGSKLLSGFENLEGSRFADLLTGDDQANTLAGLGGSDVLNGGAGDDLLEGGAGFDALEGGAGADTLFGGTGDGAFEGDIVTYFTAIGPLVFDFSTDFLDAANQSSGVIKEDTIGEDIEGFAGATNHSNTFIAGDGTNFLLGGAEADTFNGGTGTDQILGLAGDDVIYGGEGRDGLIGEGGNDLMFGDAGADVFFFDAVNEGDDTIGDFELGTDLVFFTGGRLSGPSEVTAETVEVGGDAALADARISYEVDGFASSVTVIDTDVDALLPLVIFGG